MRELEMHLTDEQIVNLLSNNIKFVVTNKVASKRKLVVFDSQEHFDKAFGLIV